MPSSSSPNTSRKSRLLGVVRRSFTIPMWRSEEPSSSLIDNRQSPVSNFCYFEDATALVPTVQQIAMGLHLSRTPHLRPVRSPHTRSQSYDTTPTSPGLRGRSKPKAKKHTPSPVKSAMKKSSSQSPSPPLTITPSASLRSTSTSTTASSHQNNLHTRLRLRMSKIIMPSQAIPRIDDDDSCQRPKKLVRFSSDTLNRFE